jgi:hypothetical protein
MGSGARPVWAVAANAAARLATRRAGTGHTNRRHRRYIRTLAAAGVASALLFGHLADAGADTPSGAQADPSDDVTLTLTPAAARCGSAGCSQSATPLTCQLHAEKPFILDGVVWTEGVVNCNFVAQYIELQVTLYNQQGVAQTDTRQEADTTSFRWPLAAFCTPGNWYARAQAYVVPPPGWLPGLWGTNSDTVALTCGHGTTTTTHRTTTTTRPTTTTTRRCPNPSHCHPE